MAIKVYGADWCHNTNDTLTQLKMLHVDFQYIDIEEDEDAAAWVRDQNGGKERKPTVDIDGKVLSVPDFEELEDALREAKIIQ